MKQFIVCATCIFLVAFFLVDTRVVDIQLNVSKILNEQNAILQFELDAKHDRDAKANQDAITRAFYKKHPDMLPGLMRPMEGK